MPKLIRATLLPEEADDLIADLRQSLAPVGAESVEESVFDFLLGGGKVDPALPEIRKAWAACEAVLAKAGPEGWVGWRRDFGNGYGDAFAFWDRRDDKAASVLRITLDIDGIARQVEPATPAVSRRRRAPRG